MLVQLVFIMVCQSILADLQAPVKPYYNVDDYEVVGRHFEKFIKTYNRQYSPEEKLDRLKMFIENLKEINEFNMKHRLTTFDISEVSDKTKTERQSRLGLKATGLDKQNGDCKPLGDLVTRDAPASYDWRDQNVVPPVKDQGICGSCWAFSATDVVESKLLQNGQNVRLSEQQMVDCDKKSHGCFGGLPTHAISEIMKQGGQESESSYPYEDSDKNGCRFDESKVAAKVANCSAYWLSGEDALKELLYKEGPLSVCVCAQNWDQYSGGIMEHCENTGLDHAVLLVGYGSENGEDYWVIKNSYGEDFGEKGFIKLRRGVNCCGIGITGKDTYAVVTAVVV